MRKAEAEGQLSGLEGEGKPLPAHPEEAFVSAGEAVGYRMMAEHGALPEEIELRRQIDAAKSAYAGAVGEAGKRTAMARLADLQMKLAITEEARRKFMR